MFQQALRSSLRSSQTSARLASRSSGSSQSAFLSQNLRQNSLQLRLLSTEARAKIQSAISATPVVLFMKGTRQEPQCGFSRAVVQVLDLHGVPDEKIQTYNVLADEELRSGIKEFSEWPTIPQVYVNGEFVGGCDIILGMHQSGELESLLEKNDVVPKITSAPEQMPSNTSS